MAPKTQATLDARPALAVFTGVGLTAMSIRLIQVAGTHRVDGSAQ